MIHSYRGKHTPFSVLSSDSLAVISSMLVVGDNKVATGYQVKRLRHRIYVLHGKAKFILKEYVTIVKPQK